jgi:hypothetical protein
VNAIALRVERGTCYGFLGPQRRAALELFDHFRRRAGARQAGQQVDMVFHPADDDGLANYASGA